MDHEGWQRRYPAAPGAPTSSYTRVVGAVADPDALLGRLFVPLLFFAIVVFCLAFYVHQKLRRPLVTPVPHCDGLAHRVSGVIGM